MRVGAKGQVTIPMELREKAGLLPHTEIEFELDGDTVCIRRARANWGRGGERVVNRLRGRATVAMSTEEILGPTREA